MISFLSFFLFGSLEIGAYLGELSPFGALAKNHFPSPHFAFYLAYPSSLSPEISCSFSEISSRFSNTYSLRQKEVRLLFFLPIALREESRSISLIPGTGVAFWERKLSSGSESRYYPDFYLGVGYREKMGRVRFRMNLLPNLMVERGKKNNQWLTNFYFFFKAELGVGYEI
jgi:hypothetical protein